MTEEDIDEKYVHVFAGLLMEGYRWVDSPELRGRAALLVLDKARKLLKDHGKEIRAALKLVTQPSANGQAAVKVGQVK